MTTTITINEGLPSVIELEQLTPPPVVGVIQPIPASVTVIGVPGGPGPTGPPGPPGEDLDSTVKRILFPVPAGYGPLVNPASLNPITSSGTPPADAPDLSYYELTFAPGVDQEWFWSFTLPGDYLSGGTLLLTWVTKGTSDEPVMWKASSWIGIPGTSDVDAAVFDTVVKESGVPSTTEGVISQTTLDLTMLNADGNRFMIVFIGRNGSNVLDTNEEVAVLLSATLEYLRA